MTTRPKKRVEAPLRILLPYCLKKKVTGLLWIGFYNSTHEIRGLFFQAGRLLYVSSVELNPLDFAEKIFAFKQPSLTDAVLDHAAGINGKFSSVARLARAIDGFDDFDIRHALQHACQKSLSAIGTDSVIVESITRLEKVSFHIEEIQGFVWEDFVIAEEPQNILPKQIISPPSPNQLSPSNEPALDRILHIDDSKLSHSFVKRNLEKRYSLIHCLNCKDAMRVLATNPDISAVLLDVNMPGMNGLDFCSTIRQLGYTLPVIMLTAKRTVIDRIRGKNAGADFFLGKPATSEALNKTLDKALKSA